MRYLILVIVFGFISCASVSVPSQDIVVHIATECGPMFIEMEAGSLDESMHYMTWWTKEEHMERIREFLKKKYEKNL